MKTYQQWLRQVNSLSNSDYVKLATKNLEELQSIILHTYESYLQYLNTSSRVIDQYRHFKRRDQKILETTQQTITIYKKRIMKHMDNVRKRTFPISTLFQDVAIKSFQTYYQKLSSQYLRAIELEKSMIQEVGQSIQHMRYSMFLYRELEVQEHTPRYKRIYS